jgi:hypothetical protein
LFGWKVRLLNVLTPLRVEKSGGTGACADGVAAVLDGLVRARQ